MEGDNYDVEGIFPEEFRKYVRDQNLICSTNRFWFFRNKHESVADRDIADKFASCFPTYIYVPEQCLVQFWIAQKVTSFGDSWERRFRLTSHNQPFLFMGRKDDKTPFSEGIFSYRMKMVDFVTGDGGGDGVIGRVFRNNRAECTPNIGYYSYEEYSHRDLAISCHIKSSLVFPLSDSSGCSIGVVEILSSVESNLLARNCFRCILDHVGYRDCCKDISGNFCCETWTLADAELEQIKEVMQVVSRSCCLVCAQTWMLCNRCGCLSICDELDNYLGGFYKQEYFECDVWSDLFSLKKGEGIVGKAVTSSHNLVYCDDVSQFSITEYPLAHFARYHKLTACFVTCLRCDLTEDQIYVLEFFLNPSKVHGRGPRAMLVPILEGMRKTFRNFKLASGEEIGDDLSVRVIDARFPDKFEILEIGKLDSVENCISEMDLIHNNSFEISAGNRGGELAVDGLAIDNGENMGSNIGEQPVAIAWWENQHNNATISSIGVINSDISLQQLVEANAVHTEENVGGAAKMLNGELPPRNGIDISLEELKEVSVNLSTLKRVCGSFGISKWPPRSGNSAQTGSTKELRGSASTVQSDSLVTIKAKYGDDFIKFKHSASSGINAFNQQVLLKLETGSYVVKYQDDDNDWILVRCDDDLQDYISSSASLGKTTLTMLLEHI